MSAPIPVSMPDELIASIRASAARLGLSAQDVIRQTVKLYLPEFEQRMRPLDLSPLPDAALAQAYREMSRAELAEEKKLGRASARPKAGDWD